MIKLNHKFFLLQEASITLCTAQRSPQQVLYQLYNAITMTELKGYAMMQFSYMLLKTYGRGEISLFVGKDKRHQ